jgi:hypothetical protein
MLCVTPANPKSARGLPRRTKLQPCLHVGGDEYLMGKKIGECMYRAITLCQRPEDMGISQVLNGGAS